MTRQVKQREKSLRQLILEEKGSYTVETSLVFPVILILTLLLLCWPFAMYVQVDTQQWTQRAVNEAAGQWVHRAQALLDGETGWQRTEGLYWRITSSGSAERLASYTPPQGFHGEMTYDRALVLSSIQGQYQAPVHVPSFFDALPSHQIGKAQAWITDPVEWIRTIDMLRVYGAELMQRSMTSEKIDQALEKFLGWGGAGEFSSHDPAAQYLRELVQGHVSERSTPYGVRKMDAMTSSGTLHQAYLTFRINGKGGLRDQMQKDAYLLEQGEVEAVVWHFFRRTGTSGKVGPSDSFIQELEQHGITVVIHDSR